LTKAENLEDMLRVSAQYPKTYNEVLVDSKVYVQNLPHSVAAFYFGLVPGEEDDRWARVHATQMYVTFLDDYGLTEAQVPLVQFQLDTPDLMTNVAEGARAFVQTHPYGYALKKWQEEHKDLAEHPERLHEVLRDEAQAQRHRQTDRQTHTHTHTQNC
jgi:hypothetical protein